MDKQQNGNNLETFFSETFFLYSQLPAHHGTCGCAVPRDALLSTLHSQPSGSVPLTCPLCGTADKIVAVLDGYSHSLMTTSKHEEKGDRIEAVAERTRSPLVFKFGSVAYQVGLAPKRPSNAIERRTVISWNLFGLFGSRSSVAPSHYAQNHMAYVLGLDQSKMKVSARRSFEVYRNIPIY